MPAIKKKLPLEDKNNPQQSTNTPQESSQPDVKEVDISHSSWLYRLTASSTKLDSNEDAELKHPNEQKAEPKEQQQIENSNGSLWSWFSYTTGKQPPIEEGEKDVTRATDISESTSRHAADQKIPDNQYRPLSYWKSFFTSNKNLADKPSPDWTVQDDEKPQQVPMEEKQQEINAKNALIEDPKPETGSCQNNAVVPSLASQFDPSISSEYSNASLLSKAINSIQSIFASHTNKPSTPSHMIVDIKKNIEDKKIVIIGVHGWFPMKLVRSMIGEPTGTSTKFCEQMSAAVKKYFETTHQLVVPEESITRIPLQYEGKVLERVEKLYELVMADWQKTIQEADVIFWVTHSQGTPVSAILLRKLLEEGLIQEPRQHVCMLAMAGISHGPFPALKGNVLVKYFEADAARELFDFMDSNSPISTQYREAMAFNLQRQVKTVLVGSMQDQVVPLYSAIMSGLSHPNILRAIYIDGHIYSADDFLIRLISFALRLLNSGLSDHGFLIHISEVLAGNLYSWDGGHSTVYEELDVFMLPLQYLFETPPLGIHRLTIADKVLHEVKARLDPFQAKLRLNPFHLPWSMRGIWDDRRILENETLKNELDTLQELFDHWHPTSAKLKEIKFRLEPLKARL